MIFVIICFSIVDEGYREADLLPDPDVDVVKGVVEPEPEVVLPDDSLADTDLHDHDMIDSVMYIYFGSSERNERSAGRQVNRVGVVYQIVNLMVRSICIESL